VEGSEILLVRRISKWKNARIVVLPTMWVKSVSTVSGKEPEYVLMKVSGQHITIEPCFDEELIKKLFYRSKKTSKKR